MNYVYQKTEPQLWTVGFHDPGGTWHTDSDHGSQEQAAERVHYLNGGNSPPNVALLAAAKETARNLNARCRGVGAFKSLADVHTMLVAAIAETEAV